MKKENGGEQEAIITCASKTGRPRLRLEEFRWGVRLRQLC
jgi:hypothetical protein